ncbi:hypothetical protein [Pelagicoccus mobilis]|nr:hypothetical protein [Pelagicoccus mobilis]
MKNYANQAAHTMSANARPFRHDRMKISITTNGTSTEADIVWL